MTPDERPLSRASLVDHVRTLVSNDALVPAGKTGALVTVISAERVQLALALKVHDGWTVDLVAQYAYGGDATFESRITKTW